MTSSLSTLRPSSHALDAPQLVLTLWTDDPDLAEAAEIAGVDRIGVDLERLGKRDRQADPRLWLSTHREDALPLIGKRLRRARLFARTNPFHDGWPEEAERLLAAGVQVLMLPAFRSEEAVRDALAVVGDRAQLVPLVETSEAMERVAAIAALPGLTEVHFGLNDLALSMGLPERFMVLTHPRLERAASTFREAGVQVGVGGIARAGTGGLPIPPDMIYAQYPRLGASGALIARSFFQDLPADPDAFGEAVERTRRRMAEWYGCDAARLERARVELDQFLADRVGTG